MLIDSLLNKNEQIILRVESEFTISLKNDMSPTIM